MHTKLATFRSHVASGKIECVYVWLTKEDDTDDACYYRFEAEIYAPGGTEAARLEPVKSESGLVRVDKLKAVGDVVEGKEDGIVKSIGARILIELRDVWRRREFPSAKFLNYCNIDS